MYETNTGRFLDPGIVVSHFHLRSGDVVAEFGAGSGHYMKPLSDAVGHEGLVYMCEIQKPLVEALGAKAQSLRLSNVRTVWGDVEVLEGTKLREASLDAGILSNTLFQIF